MPNILNAVIRRRKHRHGARSLLFAAAGVAAAITAVGFFRRFPPVMREMAVAEANNAVLAVINNALSEKLAAGEIKYGDMVTLDKDESGSVCAIITNMARVNLLKSEITSEIVNALAKDVKTNISVPLGNVTGIELLSGKGPDIPVEIVAVTRARTEFINHFSDAGINQTRHQIAVRVNAEISVLMPGRNAYSEVSAEVAVAETVIIGAVPDTFTYFEGDEKWDESLEQYDITT